MTFRSASGRAARERVGARSGAASRRALSARSSASDERHERVRVPAGQTEGGEMREARASTGCQRARARGGARHDRRRARDNARLQDLRGEDARRPERLDDGGDHLRRGHAARRLHVRGDPGRDLDRERERPGNGRHPRQPRAVAGTVPRDAPGRTQRDGQPAPPQPAQRRRPEGRLRDPAERRLPALLLELRRRPGARVRPRPALHERGGTRHRPAPGGLVASAGRTS